MLTVYTSEVGYYGVHYRSNQTLQLPADTALAPWSTGPKIRRSDGFSPMLLPESVVREHNLPSAVAWRAV
jgi:hypothetical protein